MRVIAMRALFKKTTLFATAFVLAVSTLTAAVPFILGKDAAAVSGLAYQGIPSPSASSYQSLGYEATSTNEFGDLIELAGSNRLLGDVTVSLTSWACETGSGEACVTVPGATFPHPVTVNIYNVGAGGAVGSKIATKTQVINAKYRPSADVTNCTDGRWYDAAAAACYNGFSFNQNFNLSSLNQVLPDQIIVSVAFNTSHRGYEPTSIAGPADSLNVSLPETGPVIGTDVDANVMYWNTTYAGNGSAAGVGIFGPDTGWAPFHLGVNVSTSATPTTIACAVTATNLVSSLTGWDTSNTRSQGSSTVTSDGLYIKTSDNPAGNGSPDQRKAAAYYPVNYPLTNVGTQTIAQSIDYVSMSGIAPGLQLSVDFDNNGTADGYLVGEAVYGNEWWLSDSLGFVKDNAPVVGGGFGSSYHGTLNQWLSKFPAAQVKAIGYSLGSGVTAEGTIKSITLGCTAYKFKNDAPSLTVATPTENGVVSTKLPGNVNNIAVKGVFTDDVKANYATLQLVRNGSSVAIGTFYGHGSAFNPAATYANADGSYAYNLAVPANIANGEYSLFYIGTDFEGGVTSRMERKFTVDNTKPTVELLAPTTAGPFKTTGAVITVKASDNIGVGKIVANIYKDGALLKSTQMSIAGLPTGTHTVNLETVIPGGLLTGSYSVKYNALDTAGNMSSTGEFAFVIDKTPPIAPVLAARTLEGALTSGGVTSSYGVTAEWGGVADAASYIYKYWNDIDGNYYKTNPYIVNGLTTLESSGVFDQGEGKHFMQVFAVDAVGNTSPGSNIFEVTYDKTGPAIVIPSFTMLTNVITPNVENSDTDPATTFSWAYVSGPAGGVSLSGATIAAPAFTITIDGDYVYKLTAKDAAGNATVKTFSFTYATPVVPDTEDPTAAPATPQIIAANDTPTTGDGFTDIAVLGDSNGANNTGVEGASTERNVAQAADVNSEENKGTFLGLDWFWWILIIAGLATIAWWIVAAARRHNDQE